jgi:hypothetical protein
VPEIPDFGAPQTLDVTIRGQALRFFPISAQMMFQLRPLSAPMARVVDAFVSDQGYEERQKALAAFLDALTTNGELAAKVVLDALHEADWVKRPVTAQAASAFFAKVDGPTLVEMLGAVAKVNGEAFRPLAEGLLVGVREAVMATVRGVAGGPTTTPPGET